MLEEIFGTELKIKILKLFKEYERLRFTEIKEILNSGAGSTKSSLGELVNYGILNRFDDGPKKVYYSLNKDYKEFLFKIFEIEEEFFFKHDKQKMFVDFFGIRNK